MRFLADENIPGVTVSALVKSGHDVVWVRIQAPGSDDGEVMELARSEARVLLTFDKDFGERARSADLRPPCGVILVRIPMRSPSDAVTLAALIHERFDWNGHFSVLEPGRVRMRALKA